jgi:hypothetical protein
MDYRDGRVWQFTSKKRLGNKPDAYGIFITPYISTDDRPWSISPDIFVIRH